MKQTYAVASSIGLPAAGGRFEPFETSLVVLNLIVTLQVFSALFLAGNAGALESGNAIYQLLMFAIAGGAGLVFMIKGISARELRLLTAAWPFLAFVALGCLSILWSVEPSITFRRIVALGLFTLITYYCAVRFSFERFYTVFLYFVIFYVVVAFAAAAIPGMGITPGGAYRGALRAFTGHKNEFGRITFVMLTVTVVFQVFVKHPRTKVILLGLSLIVAALGVLSRSATPLAACMAGLVFALVFHFVFAERTFGYAFSRSVRYGLGLAIAIALPFTIIFIVPWAVEAMGRDLTFTGRLPLWEYAINANVGRDWLGSGYRAFWTTENTKYFAETFAYRLEDSGSAPSNAHSAYLETWLEMGYVGLCVHLWFIVSCLAVGARNIKDGEELIGCLLIALTGFSLVYGVTERTALQYGEGLWFLLTVTYLFALKAILQRKSAH
jgi:exopolysaccharide production protein ExoQ